MKAAYTFCIETTCLHTSLDILTIFQHPVGRNRGIGGNTSTCLDPEAPAEPHQETDERLHGVVPATEAADHSRQPRRSQR